MNDLQTAAVLKISDSLKWQLVAARILDLDGEVVDVTLYPPSDTEYVEQDVALLGQDGPFLMFVRPTGEIVKTTLPYMMVTR